MKKRTKAAELYDRRLGKICPAYGVLPLIGCAAVNGLVYWGSKLLCEGRYHYDFTLPIDRSIPLDTWWVGIYILSYLFWIICYVMGAKYNTKEDFYRFVFSDMFSRVVCFAFFVIIPTTNVRPDVPSDAALGSLMQFIYDMDKPTNLFPSIHCIASMMCFFAVWKVEGVRWYVKSAIALFAVLVFASTQFTKQHYIVDIFGALAVGSLSFAVGRKTELYKVVMDFFERINISILGEEL